MNKLLNAMNTSIRSFAKEEEGAQVVEYALIIAVVSITLVLALKGITGGTGTPFGDLIARLGNCLKAGGTCT